MPIWLVLAKGPVFRFALLVMTLGLLRLAVVMIWEMAAAIHRAGDRRLPYVQIARHTLAWLLPLNRLHRNRAGYSIASFVFHLGILLAGLFLGSHLDLLKDNLGISWRALPKPLLDGLTLAAILAGGFLLVYRMYAASSRALSKISDYLLLVLLLNIFISGFVAGRSWNPFAYDGLMLFHTLNGITLALVAPFTKIAHCVLYPLIRLGSEIAWHFVPGGGEKVVQTLHGLQGRKI
jgi:nitrate reductase gamma subunit